MFWRCVVTLAAGTLIWACVGDDPSSGAAPGPPGSDGGPINEPDGGGPRTTDECVSGTKECLGNRPRACVDGRWQAPTDCTDDKPVCIAGGCEIPPSCASLLGTCGVSNPQSCCNAPVVEGAKFNRFNNTSYPATVSSVRLDRYEVTVARFRAFVGAGKGTAASPPPNGAGAHPKVSGSGWSAAYNAQLLATTKDLTDALTACAGFANATYAPAGDLASKNKPINCVTWFEAQAFCIWDGGRLPSVAEVELATRGGTQQRAFPWGADPLSTTLLFYCSASASSCSTPEGGSILDVGSKPLGAGRWGHLDLFGSLRDYALDIYRPMPTDCTDCVQLDTGAATTHAALGGSWADGSGTWSTIHNVSPTTSLNPRTSAGGFRCAYDL
jgi:formylglycine-generating enzyme